MKYSNIEIQIEVKRISLLIWEVKICFESEAWGGFVWRRSESFPNSEK